MHRNSRLGITSTILATVTLAACGGGGGDSANAGNADNSNSASADTTLIIGETSGGDASALSNDGIRRQAATLAIAGLGENLDTLSGIGEDDMPDVTTGEDMQAINELEDSSDSFFTNSLGIDDPGATTTREGNVITIDPDDTTLCSDAFPLVGDVAGDVADDQSQCEQLVSDITVQINAVTDETGIITYLFDQQPVLLVGYSPLGASYELNLGGFYQFTQTAAQIAGDVGSSTPSVSGALRLTATVLNAEPAASEVDMSLNVTQTINIDDSDATTGFTLEPSTVFSFSANETTGEVSTSVNWGALQLITQSGDSDGNESLTQINLGGLSATLSTNLDEPALTVTNIGIGDVPLTVSVNSIESVNLTLSEFGINLNEETGTLNLNGPLNARFVLNNMAELFDEFLPSYSATSTLEAPSGTQLTRQDNGSTQITAGGPVTSTFISNDDTQSDQIDVTINQGECFDTDDESDALVSEATCN